MRSEWTSGFPGTSERGPLAGTMSSCGFPNLLSCDKLQHHHGKMQTWQQEGMFVEALKQIPEVTKAITKVKG